MSWEIVPLICALPIAVGVALDRILHDNHLTPVRDFLLRLWNRLDDTPIPAIPAYIAACTLAFGAWIFGDRVSSFRTIAVTSVLSASLTIGAVTTAHIVVGDVWTIRQSTSLALSPLGAALLLLNLLFDSITLLITARLLIIITRTTPIYGIALIILDCCAAFALAFACASVALSATAYLLADVHTVPTVSELLTESLHIITSHPFTPPGIHLYILELKYYALTTFIPTLAYATLITATTIAKPLISIIRRTALYLLDSASDPKKDTVFTVFGSILAVIAAIAALVAHFVT